MKFLEKNSQIQDLWKTCDELVIRRPLRMTFELKSGKNKAKKKVMDGSRKLLFHGDEAPNEIKSKYCAIWNPAVGALGAWDTEGMIFI